MEIFISVSYNVFKIHVNVIGCANVFVWLLKKTTYIVTYVKLVDEKVSN